LRLANGSACVLAVISFARGLLFQGALTIDDTSVKSTKGFLDPLIAWDLLTQFFLTKGSDPRTQGTSTTLFLDVLKELDADDALLYPHPLGCYGQYCTGTVKVGGL